MQCYNWKLCGSKKEKGIFYVFISCWIYLWFIAVSWKRSNKCHKSKEINFSSALQSVFFEEDIWNKCKPRNIWLFSMSEDRTIVFLFSPAVWQLSRWVTTAWKVVRGRQWLDAMTHREWCWAEMRWYEDDGGGGTAFFGGGGERKNNSREQWVIFFAHHHLKSLLAPALGLADVSALRYERTLALRQPPPSATQQSERDPIRSAHQPLGCRKTLKVRWVTEMFILNIWELFLVRNFALFLCPTF